MQTVVTDINALSVPCEEVTLETGHTTGRILVDYLKNNANTATGISANQLGIQHRVCALVSPYSNKNNDRYYYFINPKIVESTGSFRFDESCLSFPNQIITTERFKEVLIDAENIEGLVSFYADPKKWSSQLECACIQHEIDHLNGITMFARLAPPLTYKRSTPKVGRNEKCPCNSNKKFKKCCAK